jgi:uncharacterized protein YecE (DUF72 family)
MAFIGTAGWSISATHAHAFPGSGTHLERYGAVLNAVEINSSFYRPHRQKTYARWAASVPEDFRFSVKLPRTITHHQRLIDFEADLARFREEVSGLGPKLGIILVQLPPKLVYDPDSAAAFFQALEQTRLAAIACEPRHPSWFTPAADAALTARRIARVAADPPRADDDGSPGGWQGLRYWRLHGSPKIYYSDYPRTALVPLAAELKPDDWCIFDNTAAFAALGNALDLKTLAAT